MRNLILLSFFLFSFFLDGEKTDLDLSKSLRDCTVHIEGTFDGVEVDVEVTISDTSWLKCQALKAKVALLNATSE